MYVYIMTNPNHTVLYIGVTNDLHRRVYEHKNKLLKGFTSRYNLNQLVYYEAFDGEEQAISREKQLKKYYRKAKEQLISNFNPFWHDLYEELFGYSDE